MKPIFQDKIASASRLTAVTALAGLVLLFSSQAAEARRAKRSLLYTVGHVESKGWESNLVKSNPNLKHYHWNPIYSSVKQYRPVSPPPPPPQRLHAPPAHTAAKMQPRPSVYRKPIHMAPTARVHASNPLPAVPRDAQGRLITRQPQTSTAAGLNYSNTDARLRAPGSQNRGTDIQLTSRNTAPALRRTGKQVGPELAFKDPRGELAARQTMPQLSTRTTSAQLATRNTQAQLVSQNTTAQFASPQVLTYGPSYVSPFAQKHKAPSYRTSTKTAVRGAFTTADRNY